MFTFVQFFAFAMAITTIYGASFQVSDYNFQVSDSSSDYFMLAYRQFLRDINKVDAKIAAVDRRILDRKDFILNQNNQLLEDIKETTNANMLLQLISESRYYCIDKYGKKYVDYSSAEQSLLLCDKIQVDRYTREAKASTQRALTEIDLLVQRVQMCEIRYKGSSLENCYKNYVSESAVLVKKYLRLAEESLEQNLFTASFDLQTFMDCSSDVEKNTLKQNNDADNVIETCQKCYKPDNNETC